MSKAWSLSHRRKKDLVTFSLTMFGETRQLTVDVNAPPIPYPTMMQWFYNIFMKVWWEEQDGRNWMYYNGIAEDFCKVIVKYRNDRGANYPF